MMGGVSATFVRGSRSWDTVPDVLDPVTSRLTGSSFTGGSAG